MVVRVIVLALYHTVTATTDHALVTLISVSAICTENQWIVRRIAPVSGHTMVTVITGHVRITNTKVLATNTACTSVVPEVALVVS